MYLCLEEKIEIMIYPDPEKLLIRRCELLLDVDIGLNLNYRKIILDNA